MAEIADINDDPIARELLRLAKLLYSRSHITPADRALIVSAAELIAAERTATGGEEPKPVTSSGAHPQIDVTRQSSHTAPAVPAPDKAQEEVAQEIAANLPWRVYRDSFDGSTTRTVDGAALSQIIAAALSTAHASGREEMQAELDKAVRRGDVENRAWVAAELTVAALKKERDQWMGEALSFKAHADRAENELADLSTKLETAVASGREEGERAMREAAAKVAELIRLPKKGSYHSDEIAAEIRALPIPSPTQERGE